MAKDNVTPTLEEIGSLKYAEKYVGLESHLQLKYQAIEVTAFRMVHDPIKPIDSLPLAERQPQRARIGQTQEQLREMHELMSDNEKDYEVKLYGLSHFTTPLQCALTLHSHYEKLKETNPQEAENYRNQFGTFIVKVNYTGADGLSEIEQNSKGHFTFLPQTGYVLEEHIDPEFGKQPYETIIENENHNQ